MNPILSFFIRSFAAVPVAMFTGLVSFLFFHVNFLPSVGLALASGGITYLVLGVVMTSLFLKKHQLSRKEYRYIKKNLAEAKKKISRLNKSLFSIRDLSSVKQRIDILRIVKKIQKMAQKEPKRFYQAEQFYFSHLDSVVELTEKYSFLASQPKKSLEINQSLIETRQTLNELTKVLEEDLYHVVSDDVDHLNFEIDVAKHSIKKQKELKFPEENRWLK
ncbi:5-bromo-4-chloroindolyl phosphate hydrolysis family protein [Neobacillus thermocopriae]|uniref:Protein xpaC n=1 Tax=Neobacillus thermocopriae TaxID=1215031 RepID=A0A6B3TKP9_9BACI|nr:5-bromo-4-chloroindolyl phosphate hydrolysis family protein [Neobacillus thermocopriae]MED3622543.1 5-bromo-4-chloroindolyl phosphate hydrolysis family protein [Neobacillus thermocopriae]MED3712647.1 5-bromo-4-chloroindolyl phosphate hydrolysis family protein [Neobacillus thermocopriae]NEX77504.1 protein xpaC [Neobacillus thermocopriae]